MRPVSEKHADDFGVGRCIPPMVALNIFTVQKSEIGEINRLLTNERCIFRVLNCLAS